MKNLIKVLIVKIVLINFGIYSQSNVPEWSKGIVWYQIFPERFTNGDNLNEPEAEKVFINSDSIPTGWKITEWGSNWFAQSDWEKKPGGNFSDHLYERRYGGDIQGIINRLDYLKELGIGAIYLNPVFEAASLHKYDGSTFHHIDVNFGPDPSGDRKIISEEYPDNHETWEWTSADSLFLKLIEEVHQRGMKIIIDGVFNHTGVQFWAFQDILKNGINSKYKDWYRIEVFDDPTTPQNEFSYKGWWGVKSLPEFNKSEKDLNPGPKQYIFHSTMRWMDPNNDGNPDDGIDGWRLDVAREVPIGFWKDWSRLVKQINSEALIIGELWELSPDFVADDAPFDALMNYNFAFAVNNFFIAKKTKIAVSDFVKKLLEINKTYPAANLHALQNLLDSHDTDRLSSMIKNPDREYDRNAKEDNPDYDPGKPDSIDVIMQKLIAAFQLTYIGSPMIYYGDEVGMWGADDPHCRKPMVWPNLIYDDEIISEDSGFKTGLGKYKVEQNANLKMYYQKIIALRNSSVALKKGNINFLYINNEKKTFSFERKFKNDNIIAAFNLGDTMDSMQVYLNFNKASYSEVISGETGTLFSGEDGLTFNFDIPPMTAKIYRIQESK